jgi:sigma-E factor negative regulatory protein RseA
MTDTLKEQLSAFLDGELPEAETTLLLKRLERDDELKATLSRYSLIGAVMRSDGDVPAARHVAARVRAALAGEPSLAATGGARWARPVAGLAIAATVAMATVLLLPQWFGAGEEAPVPMAAAVPGAPERPTGVAEPATGSLPVVVAAYDEPALAYTTPPAPAEPADGLPSAQLASYLVAHSEYTLPLTRRSVITAAPQQAAEPREPDANQAGR